MPTAPDPGTADHPATDHPATDHFATADRLPLRRRLLPVIALLLLAPWAAECSWGGSPSTTSCRC